MEDKQVIKLDVDKENSFILDVKIGDIYAGSIYISIDKVSWNPGGEDLKLTLGQKQIK